MEAAGIMPLSTATFKHVIDMHHGKTELEFPSGPRCSWRLLRDMWPTGCIKSRDLQQIYVNVQ
jgi:hypothetical protein